MKRRTALMSYASYSCTETVSWTRRRSLKVCCQMLTSVQAQGIINSRTRANITPFPNVL